MVNVLLWFMSLGICLFIICLEWVVEELLHNNEALFRLGAFTAVLGLMLLWEALNPRRTPLLGWNRRLNNLGLVGLDVILVRFLMPIATVLAIVCTVLIPHGSGDLCPACHHA